MLHNLSPWQAQCCDSWSIEKAPAITVVVKQSFEYDEHGEVSSLCPCEEIIFADEYAGEPGVSSLTAANEMVPFKAAFECYGQFRAELPKGKEARVLEVELGLTAGLKQTNDIKKRLRVVGDRVWQNSLLGKVVGDPQPLVAMDIRYEKTYGGVDLNNADKMCMDNPAGIGFNLKSKQAKGLAVVNIEYADQFIKRPGQSIKVAGFGPIPEIWQPRLDRQAEIDQAAMINSEYPFKDALDKRFYQYAPDDQQITADFDEQWVLSLTGFITNKDYGDKTDICLPYQVPQLSVKQGEQLAQRQMKCDTLVVDTPNQAFHLLWRVQIEKKKPDELCEIIVTEAKGKQS
ncbi:DUF2169 domain-containing protein [Catenovulum sp. SM1970]|uniref:DUF2169 family type VI secretion system accessory protein n=1 Tax=Marinifaba aquimaris TaxID=2741323 RepID=UPI001574436C|nr:DUF2169 domain-containing protein [Marinifaba aquimaris]NTS78245.1 DUF2169 domain-containing protein [Marinifaba aquimaris]